MKYLVQGDDLSSRVKSLIARADPLHLALVFGLSHTTASKYTLIACDLLADQPAEAASGQHYAPDCGRP